MFDLETAIADWKQSLESREALSAENIDELEAHLRESAEILVGQGLNEEEALLIAQRRVGSSVELGTEFTKENRRVVWERRLKWICIGQVLLWALSQLTIPMITVISYFLDDRTGIAWPVPIGYAISVMTALMVASQLSTRFPQILDQIESRAERLTLRKVLFGTVCLMVIPRIPLIIISFLDAQTSMAAIGPYLGLQFLSLAVPALSAIYIVLLHRREQRAELA